MAKDGDEHGRIREHGLNARQTESARKSGWSDRASLAPNEPQPVSRGMVTLVDHEAIRDWAAARAGFPAILPAEPSIEQNEPSLVIVFGQHTYQDQDRGADRPPTMGGPEQVEWEEWFEIFDARGLALMVAEDRPGVREQFHELVAR